MKLGLQTQSTRQLPGHSESPLRTASFRTAADSSVMPVPAPLASKPLPAQTYDPAYDTATKQATTEIDLASKPV